MNSLRVNFQEGDLPSIHPHDLIIHLRGISTAKVLYEGLTRIDEKGKVHLAGAESVDISLDRQRYTFVLRDNKWSNGTPVTSTHYAEAMKASLEPSSTCSRANLLYMIKNAESVKKGEIPLSAVGIQTPDDKTIVIDLAYPSPFFLELLAQPICAPLIDPKQKQPKAFNGPFALDVWERDNVLRLKPNPHFWNRKAVSLKQIEIFMMSDPSAAFNAFEKQQIDWIGLPLSGLSTEQIHSLKAEGTLVHQPIDRAFWIFLNTKHPALCSTAIRQALSMSLNRAAITEHILVGGDPLQKTLPMNLLPIKSPSPIKEDLEAAKLSFQQGLKELGLKQTNFPPITISYGQQANRKKFAEYLQDVWSRTFGIEVRLQQQEWNVLRANLEKGLFDVAASYEAAYYKDAAEIFDRLGFLNPSNFTQWVNHGYRTLLSSATREKDTHTRLELLGKAERILLEELPFIPVCADRFLFGHRKGMQGYAFDSVGAIDFSYASFNAR